MSTQVLSIPCEYPKCTSEADELCTESGKFYCEDCHVHVHGSFLFARSAERMYEDARPFGEWP